MKHRCRIVVTNERGICAVRCSTVQYGAVQYEYNLSLSLSISPSGQRVREARGGGGREKE